MVSDLFRGAFESCSTPDELEALIRACDGYMNRNLLGIFGPTMVLSNGDTVDLFVHRQEAREVRSQAYKKLGIKGWVPGSFGTTSCKLGVLHHAPLKPEDRKARGEARRRSRLPEVLRAVGETPFNVKGAAELLDIDYQGMYQRVRDMLALGLIEPSEPWGWRNHHYKVTEKGKSGL